MRPRLSISLHEAGVRRDGRWVLEDVNLELRGGERWALTGPNGAGKTHLLKLLSTQLWPTPTGRERRRFALGRRVLDEGEAKPMLAYLGAEAQDRYARRDWNLEVRLLLVAAVQGTDLPLEAVTPAQRRRVATLLREAGLQPLARRRFLTLSYGQKRLVLMARCLARRPHWLLLDEPYNGLDARWRARLDALLARARRHGTGWVVSAHRRADVPAGTRRLMVLEQGRLVRRADLSRSARWLPPDDGAAPRHGGPTSAPRAAQRASAARRGTGATPLIRLTRADLHVEYRRVLEGVDWVLRRGEHWAITGANGAGKSSFLRLLYGDLAPADGGSIERTGFARGTPIEEWKKTVGYVSPDLHADYAIDVSIRDLVISGRHASIGLNERADADDIAAVAYWIRHFDLEEFIHRRPRELSYGQLRRALLARAMAAAPRLLLLDEPFTGLDAAQRAAMRSMLDGLMARGITVVMAVHHAEDLPAGMTHVLHLHKQRACARALRIATRIPGD